MELVKFIYTKNSAESEPVKGHTFLEEWTELFNNVGFFNAGGSNYDQRIAGKLNLDDQCKEFQRLKLDFSENQLQCTEVQIGDQQSRIPEKTKLPTHNVNNYELETLKMQKKEIQKRRKDAISRRTTLTQFRYLLCPEQSSLLPVPITPSLVEGNENGQAVYIVQIFRPVSADEKYNLRKYQFIPKRLDHIIAVLGTQSLTALRDKIQCCSDNIVLGEYSDDPKLILKGRKSKEVFKSAFFYIGSTFYNDLRYKECTDYSSELIQHSNDPKRSLGPFSSKKMEETNFNDLQIELGYPYLYMHQGNCEHVIVFSDIRLLDFDESGNPEDYPFVCRVMQRRRLVCMLCNTFTARWVTTGNQRVSNDPYFYCESCFNSFNYTADGKKIGDFRAYCYVDRTTI